MEIKTKDRFEKPLMVYINLDNVAYCLISEDWIEIDNVMFRKDSTEKFDDIERAIEKYFHENMLKEKPNESKDKKLHKSK